jgi:hypothetical protein
MKEIDKTNSKESDGGHYAVPVYRLQLVQDGTADVSPLTNPADVTRLVLKAGALLGIRVFDHVVLAPDGGCFSYKDCRPDCLEG